MFRNRIGFAVASPFFFILILRVNIHDGWLRTLSQASVLAAALAIILQGVTTARSAVNFCSVTGVTAFGVCEVAQADYRYLYQPDGDAASEYGTRAETSSDLIEDTTRGRLAWRVVADDAMSPRRLFEVAGAGVFRLTPLLALAIDEVPSSLGIQPIRGELVELPQSKESMAARAETREFMLYARLLGDSGD